MKERSLRDFAEGFEGQTLGDAAEAYETLDHMARGERMLPLAEVTEAERRADLEEDHEAHAGGYVNVDFDSGEVTDAEEPQVPPNADAEG